MNHTYNDYLKSLTYKQLKHEKMLLTISLRRFKAEDIEAINSLNYCNQLIIQKETELRQNGF